MDHDEGMSVLLANGGFFGHFKKSKNKCSTFYLDDEVLQTKEELMKMFCEEIFAYTVKQRIKVETIVCPQNAIRFSIMLEELIEKKMNRDIEHLYVPPGAILDCAKSGLEFKNALVLDTECLTGRTIDRLINLVQDCKGCVSLAAVIINRGRETASSLYVDDFYACVAADLNTVAQEACRLCADGVPWDKVPQIAVSV